MFEKWIEVCQLLKDARKAANVTQSQIGDALGYVQQTIAQFEKGDNRNGVILLYYLELFPDVRKPVLEFLGCVNEYEGV